MVLKQMWLLFDRKERWRLVLLACAQLGRALVEVAGVASIVPFVGVVTNPALIGQNHYLSAAYHGLGFSSTAAFLTALGVAVIASLALANSVSALAQYGLLRFSWGMHYRLSMRLLGSYLHRPYGFFTTQNSAALSKTLLSEIQTVISSVLIPALDGAARSFVICALVAMLVAVNPELAVTSAIVLGGAYGAVYLRIKHKQEVLGVRRVEANRLRFKIAGEAFGGIKDVKVLEREGDFLERFRTATWRYASTSSSNAIIQVLPRYLLETLAFGGIVLLVLVYLRSGRNVADILPMISLYAVAGYRMMPQLQQLFANVAMIRFNRASLEDLLENYEQVDPQARVRTGLTFDRQISFEAVSFAYPGAATPALDGVSLSIGKNQTIGLVGSSGSGKTTLVDLLLGLYQPDAGRIRVDGVDLDETTMSAWRREIGYVPQSIFLMDDTIAANIAFGLPTKEITPERVRRAAKIAHLDDFIQMLPEGYETVVGERGVRLSGGQRQRIGIARALYHDPSVLVMDEATSALDGATENAVMQAIHDLTGQKTIILIAHRLSTVQDCTVIHMLERGRIVQSGTYETMLRESAVFREFAGKAVAMAE